MIEVRSELNWSPQTNIFPAPNICENQIYYLLGGPSQNIAMIPHNRNLVIPVRTYRGLIYDESEH